MRNENTKALVAEVEKTLVLMRDTLNIILPPTLSAEKFSRITIQAIKTNPDLVNYDRSSLYGAIVKAAQLGLELNTPLGHAYLVPYKRKVTFQIGYKGLLELAYRSGEIAAFDAEIVYKNDEFVYERGTNPKLGHKPSFDEERGPIRGAYAVAHLLRTDLKPFVVMSKADIDKIAARSASASASHSPWKSDYEMMAKKTVLKRLTKYLPAAIALARGVYTDDRAEAGYVTTVKASDLENTRVIDAEDLDAVMSEEQVNEELSQAREESNGQKLADSAKLKMLAAKGGQ